MSKESQALDDQAVAVLEHCGENKEYKGVDYLLLCMGGENLGENGKIRALNSQLKVFSLVKDRKAPRVAVK